MCVQCVLSGPLIMIFIFSELDFRVPEEKKNLFHPSKNMKDIYFQFSSLHFVLLDLWHSICLSAASVMTKPMKGNLYRTHITYRYYRYNMYLPCALPSPDNGY